MGFNVRDWFRNPQVHLANIAAVRRRKGLTGCLRFCLGKLFPRPEIVIAEFIRSRRGDYRGVYVLPVTITWEAETFQRAQQMALAFAKAGWLVVYVEPPLLNPVGNVLSPAPGLFVVSSADFRRSLSGLEGCLVSLYSTALLWNGSPSPAEMLSRGNRVVYEYIDHIDEFVSGPETAGIRAAFDAAIALKSVISFAASARVLREELLQRGAEAVLYSPNGVEPEHFSRKNVEALMSRVCLPAVLRGGRVKIGYFGSLAKWLDSRLLDEVMRAHPEWDFIFIGPEYVFGGADFNRARPNCHCLGPIPYSVLPAYASCFDVAMLPFVRGEIARATSPVKLFEYFALGKSVIVTPDMAECTAFKEVLVANGPEDFARQVEKALAVGHDLQAVAALRRLAEDNSWDRRAEELIRGVGLEEPVR